MADSEYMLYLAKREGAESFSKHVVLTDYCERKFVSPVDAEREFDDLVASGGIRWHQVASGGIRWHQVASGGIRWHQVASGGIR